MSKKERRENNQKLKQQKQMKQQKQQTLSVTPDPKTEVAVPKNANDPIPVTALAALYQGEKTDASAVFNTAFVMMGVAVAYLVGMVPCIGKLSEEPTAKLFLVLLPFPLWLIGLFHSLMTLNAMRHGISVQIIEDALFGASGLPRAKRDLVGSKAGDKIMDITQSEVAHKITTVVVYAGVVLLVVGFTFYTLYSATRVVKDDVILAHAPVVEVAAATYFLLLFMIAWSWFAGIRMIIKGRKEIPKHEN